MILVSLLGIIAALLQASGYFSYYKLTKNPNAASWLIWFYGNALMMISYISFTKVTWVESLPIVCAVLNLVIVILFYFQKKFSMPDKTEWFFVGIDISITILWLVLSYVPTVTSFYYETCNVHIRCDIFIHVLLLLSAVISFVPIFRQTLINNAEGENAMPWLFWSSAYAVWFIAELVHKGIANVDNWSLVYPFVYFWLHCIMAIIILKKKPKASIC